MSTKSFSSMPELRAAAGMSAYRGGLWFIIAGEIHREDEGQRVHETSGVLLNLAGYEGYVQ